MHAVQLLALLGAVLAAVAPVATILAAVGLGWWISALVSLVIGTPKATPTLHSVGQALSALGISVDELALADPQTWGETRFVGRAPDGASASIVVIGRDGADARLVSKLWRSLLYRDAGPSIAVTRSAQLEHRAYMLLMAAKAGVPVSEVVIATSGGREDTALLVLLDPDGRPLSELDADLLDDATLDDAWDNLIRLHDARLSHGQLGAVNVLVLPDGSTAFVDFSQGSAGAPEERCLRDRVNLLASTAALVGDERALHAAMRAVGADGIEAVLPMMETAALAPVAKRAVPEPKKQLKSLREAGAAEAGCDVPELTELRRVSPGSVIMAAATFLGFYLIVAQFAGVDLRATLAEADWTWVVVAFAISFVPQFSGSVALMGAVEPAVAVRAGARRAVRQQLHRAHRRHDGHHRTGHPVLPEAGPHGRDRGQLRGHERAGRRDRADRAGHDRAADHEHPVRAVVGQRRRHPRLIVIGIIVIGVAITIALLVPKLRRALRQKVGPQVAVARDNLKAILSNPRKSLMIFGGNLCSQIAYALVIDAALRAYGASLPLVDIIVINSLASLVGGMAPVPGGMGVIEAGLIAGMTAAGVPQSEAVAATFTARLFTAYLPPIWGWAALQWLRRRDYV